jgi:hypothetical protein
MAVVIPEFSLAGQGGRDYGQLAELQVFESLKQNLNQDVLVIHSQDYQARNQYFECFDGEIDFLIIDPDCGIIVLEVKSGSIQKKSDGRWYQNEQKMKMSPFEQAKRNFYFLKRLLAEKFPKEEANFPVGYAVCFPDLQVKPDHFLSEADAGVIISGRELPQIQIVLQNIFASYASASITAEVTMALKRIKDSLSSGILYESSLPMRLAHEEKARFRLTENQARILNLLKNHAQVLISGNPGTGKSILALRKAKELAMQGKSVLLLCFNSLLSRQFLRQAEESGYVDKLKIVTFHTLAWEYVEQQTGKKLPYNSDENFWQQQVPEMYVQALKAQPNSYDAVIIDEAQDFHPAYFEPVKLLLRQDSYCYIFYDPNQNIWGTDLRFPVKKEPYELSGNCRNTVNICKAVKKWTGIQLQCLDDAPLGHAVEEIECRNREEVHEAIESIFAELITERGLKPNDIVILGAHSMKNTSLQSAGPIKIGAWEITASKEVLEGQIPYYTYMSFKGCESPVVIIIDVNKKDKRWGDPKALLTAMTRAKSVLYILQV